jgi:hypothetical protein
VGISYGTVPQREPNQHGVAPRLAVRKVILEMVIATEEREDERKKKGF